MTGKSDTSHVHGVDELTDVDTTTAAPSVGDRLEWNGTNWVPTNPAHLIDDLTDVDTTTGAPSTGDRLEWNGTNWVPVTPNLGNCYYATATAEAATTSGSYQNGLTITNPPAGDYLVTFSACIEIAIKTDELETQIAVGGTTSPASSRKISVPLDGDKHAMSTTVRVTTNGSQSITGEFRRSAGAGGEVRLFDRTMTATRVTNV